MVYPEIQKKRLNRQMIPFSASDVLVSQMQNTITEKNEKS